MDNNFDSTDMLNNQPKYDSKLKIDSRWKLSPLLEMIGDHEHVYLSLRLQTLLKVKPGDYVTFHFFKNTEVFIAKYNKAVNTVPVRIETNGTIKLRIDFWETLFKRSVNATPAGKNAKRVRCIKTENVTKTGQVGDIILNELVRLAC